MNVLHKKIHILIRYFAVGAWIALSCVSLFADNAGDKVLKEFPSDNIGSLDKEHEIRAVNPDSVPKTKKCRLHGKLTAWVIDNHYLFSDGSGTMRIVIEGDEYRNNRDALGRYFEIAGTVQELKLTGEYGFVVSKIRPASDSRREPSSTAWSGIKKKQQVDENQEDAQ